MNSGIYLITNQVNHKIYVGKAVNFENRWKNHSRSYRSNKTEEHKQRIAPTCLGRKHSEATKAKMSAPQQRRREGSD